MKPINFTEANKNYVAPRKGDGSIVEGYEDCQDLPIFEGTCEGKPVKISLWEFTDEEVAELVKTKQLWVYIFANHVVPIGFATSYPFQEVKENAE